VGRKRLKNAVLDTSRYISLLGGQLPENGIRSNANYRNVIDTIPANLPVKKTENPKYFLNRLILKGPTKQNINIKIVAWFCLIKDYYTIT
jgi:hypothetical protein